MIAHGRARRQRKMRGGEKPVRHNLALAAAPMLPSRAAAAF
ncbi:hypothetical protein [Rhodococcus sp. 14-1411-2a]|nr:hypothetical protein [Rhodococcus sp. 14-1411-2a]